MVLAGGSVGLKEMGEVSQFFPILSILGVEVCSGVFPGSSVSQSGLLAWHTAVMQQFKCCQSGFVEHTQCAATMSLGSNLAFMVITRKQ